MKRVHLSEQTHTGKEHQYNYYLFHIVNVFDKDMDLIGFPLVEQAVGDLASEGGTMVSLELPLSTMLLTHGSHNY